MSKSFGDEFTEQLFEAILELETKEECYKFFEDICTVKEVKALGQRLEVAKLLKNGSTYQEIADKTGASSATISRVKRYLNYGAEGYGLILDRLED